MEEEELDLGDLCAEILENWSTPYMGPSSRHQNPFSLEHPLDSEQINSPCKIDFVGNNREHMGMASSSTASNGPCSSLIHAEKYTGASPLDKGSCCNANLETTTSTSKLNDDEDRTRLDRSVQDSELSTELEQKQDKILKTGGISTGTARITSHENVSKYEQVEKKSRSAGVDRTIIPVLVADTFFDKLLGHGVDGVDIATLNTVKDAKVDHEAEGNLRMILNENGSGRGPSIGCRNTGKEKDKLNLTQKSSRFDLNILIADGIPKGLLMHGESKRKRAMSTASPPEVKGCSRCGSLTKLKFTLPSNRTIFDVDIDTFEEKFWRNPGVDLSDFFNYGLDENQWKDYCKVMQARLHIGSSVINKTTGHRTKLSCKKGVTGEVKQKRGIDECSPSKSSKDLTSCDSQVIIEVVMHESFHGNDYKGKHIKVNNAVDDADPRPNNGNKQKITCRMINGDSIVPFPMDSCSSYSAEDDRTFSR